MLVAIPEPREVRATVLRVGAIQGYFGMRPFSFEQVVKDKPAVNALFTGFGKGFGGLRIGFEHMAVL